uniref:Uncharacterized protein n=1 Tax=Arundo donax TaxID=35708 RepID=A0A0A9E901_ARUDO
MASKSLIPPSPDTCTNFQIGRHNLFLDISRVLLLHQLSRR